MGRIRGEYSLTSQEFQDKLEELYKLLEQLKLTPEDLLLQTIKRHDKELAQHFYKMPTNRYFIITDLTLLLACFFSFYPHPSSVSLEFVLDYQLRELTHKASLIKT